MSFVFNRLSLMVAVFCRKLQGFGIFWVSRIRKKGPASRFPHSTGIENKAVRRAKIGAFLIFAVASFTAISIQRAGPLGFSAWLLIVTENTGDKPCATSFPRIIFALLRFAFVLLRGLSCSVLPTIARSVEKPNVFIFLGGPEGDGIASAGRGNRLLTRAAPFCRPSPAP